MTPLRFRKSLARCGGFTLLEIVISIAILLGALTAIFQLISVGSQAAVQAQFRSDAVLYAETKLQEALGGVISMESTSGATLEENPDWTWSMTVEPGDLEGLLNVSVTLLREGDGPGSSHTYTLQRIVRDPQLFLDAALGE